MIADRAEQETCAEVQWSRSSALRFWFGQPNRIYRTPQPNWTGKNRTAITSWN